MLRCYFIAPLRPVADSKRTKAKNLFDAAGTTASEGLEVRQVGLRSTPARG